MNKELRKLVSRNETAMRNSKQDLRSVYEIMFQAKDHILCEYTDQFRIKKLTFGQMDAQIRAAAAGLYQRIGAAHTYIALEMENCPQWVVAFWAILMSGNKPYLVNLNYPKSLSNGILKTLQVEYTLCKKESELDTKSILVDSLYCDGPAVPQDVFEDEFAFSSSATSMKEVICFYTGYQISQQLLGFRNIVTEEPRMAKHYHGQLKHLAFLPFYHIFGLFAVYFWFSFYGCTMVFLPDYSADTIARTVRRHEVTHVFAVPVLWHGIEKQVMSAAREQGEKKLQKLQSALKMMTALQNVFPSMGCEIAKRVTSQVTDKLFGKSVMFCISGGSYIRNSAIELMNGLGYCMHNGYGMSETGITSVELRKRPKHRNLNSIGKPFGFAEYRIDEKGILQIRSATLCTHKLVNGEDVQLDGWFSTGDNMTEKDGHYYILGRQSDVVIGENGENINPDTVENLFAPEGAKALSVLGLQEQDSQHLSIIVQLNPYATDATIAAIKQQVYSINDTLPKTGAITRFYFTTDPIMAPKAIKASRSQLQKQIQSGQVRLTPFSQMISLSGEDPEDSPLVQQVRSVVAQVLDMDIEQVQPHSHLFYDLGAGSIQYFTILSKLSEEFGAVEFDNNEAYCYTPQQLAKYIERKL